MIKIDVNSLKEEGATIAGGWLILPANNGFLFLLRTWREMVAVSTDQPQYWREMAYPMPRPYSKREYVSKMIFVSPSGQLTDCTPKNTESCTLGMIGNETHVFASHKVESLAKVPGVPAKRKRITSPIKTYCPPGCDWNLYKLDDKLNLVSVGKDKRFVAKSELCNKIHMMHKRVMVCASALRSTASKVIVSLMFGDVALKNGQVLIGSIDSGFPIVESKIMEFESPVTDCVVSKDGLTGCILLSPLDRRSTNELLIIDL